MKYSIDRPPLAEKFELPSRDTLLKLKIGDLVKIIFREENEGTERMWVIITKQQSSIEWTGKLDNEPFGEKMKDVLHLGEEVIFNPLDIIQTWEEKPKISTKMLILIGFIIMADILIFFYFS